MTIELADFIPKPIGFEYKFNDDKTRGDFLSSKGQQTTLFCPNCGGERGFIAIHYTDTQDVAIKLSTSNKNIVFDNSIKRIKFACTCGKSVEIILEAMPNSRLVKIGQYPDATQFDVSVNSDAIKLLSKGDKEYRLNAAKAYYSGLYIAAFNYLRRVFESLVKQAETQADITEPKQYMSDRVKELVEKGVFDEYLKDTGFSVLYKLLSSGIHELSEGECEKQYLVLQDAIDTILEDKLHEQIRQRRREENSKKLNKINSR